MTWSLQFKLEVEEVDDAAPDLAKYRHDVSQPLIIQVRFVLLSDVAEICYGVSVALFHCVLFITLPCLQILQQPDDDSGRETIVEQWDMQFDGVPPTHHLRTVSYDDEPTIIYKRMVWRHLHSKLCCQLYEHLRLQALSPNAGASLEHVRAVCHGPHTVQLCAGASCLPTIQSVPGPSWGSI